MNQNYLKMALCNWVESFMDEHRLFCSHGILGLSGGKDSMLLAVVLLEMLRRRRFDELSFVHVDHGLRSDSFSQAKFIEEWASNVNANFFLERLDRGQVPNSNKESWARKNRYQCLKKYLRSKSDRLYLGHHIDDSLEWYLHQLFNSSQGENTMGIPLINGPIARPFHCLSRKQISYFVKKLNLPFVHDYTNDDINFKRNYLRHEVILPLKKNYPKALSHYVSRANQFHLQREAKKKLIVIENICEGASLLDLSIFNGSIAVLRDDIIQLLKTLSSNERGKWRKQIDNLILSIKTNGRRGPFSFSGGIQIFVYPKLIIGVNKVGFKNLKELDRRLELLNPRKASYIPFLVFENPSKVVGLKFDPLFPITLKEIEKRGLQLQSKNFFIGKNFPNLRFLTLNNGQKY